MLESYNMTIKINETKVMIKRTGEIGTVIGIGYNTYGDYVVKVKIPYGHNNNCYVNTYDLTDIVPYKKGTKYTRPDSFSLPTIKAVYFNDPLTCVIWEDGVKTFVKNVDGESKYDKEKALAMAISKRAFGNKYNYYKIFEKHHAIDHVYDGPIMPNAIFDDIASHITDNGKNLAAAMTLNGAGDKKNKLNKSTKDE